jgi:hypothetical protein
MLITSYRIEDSIVSSLVINLMNELHCALSGDDQRDIWGNPGERALDDIASVVADYYIQYESGRDTIRDELLEFQSLWSLVLFVRRMGLLLGTNERDEWLDRGLAVASMIDANCDYRDLIVSLVVLKSLAIDAGLNTDAAFDRAIGWSTERMIGILSNARNHDQFSMGQTMASFGPHPRMTPEYDNKPMNPSGRSGVS